MGGRDGQWNKGVYTRMYDCPTCGVSFGGPTFRPTIGISQSGPLGKQCPNGHFHSMYELTRQDRRRPNAGMALRALGVSSGEVDSLTIGLQAMLGAYDRVLDQFPAGSHARALLEGAFQHPVKVARELVA